MMKIDIFNHLNPIFDVGRIRKFRKSNYEATKALAALSLTLKADRFIHISTTDVYGLKDFHGEAEEDLPFCNNRNNPYPKYKIASEKWLRSHYPSNQLVIIRPAAVWGLNDKTLTQRIIAFLKWSPFIIHFGKWRGKNRWPLAHVKNVATMAYIAACEDEALGKAVNVLDNEKISVDEFYAAISQIFFPKKTFSRMNIPLGLSLPFSWIITKISNVLNLQKPFLDPSLYALFSVSHNLDFSNSHFLQLMQKRGQKVLSYKEGIEELKSHQTAPSQLRER